MSELSRDPNLQSLAEAFLRAAQRQEDYTAFTTTFATIPQELLHQSLVTDGQRLAFWINQYNAWFLILRRDRRIPKPQVYQQRLLTIAGQSFSLDEIEHGILRRFRWKWALGYLPHPFPRPLIRQLAVQKRDSRIHFALNCGAQSCPPIGFYRPEVIDNQLALATASFLEAETQVTAKTIQTSRLLAWYIGDFGGRKGIRKLLRSVLGPMVKQQPIRFKAYDWTENFGRFMPSGTHPKE
ncbi:MAG: DUF547 domain-containing protein [Lewinellaceae bacterium]|nr:DUF547 domain-containing protein [Lewinellaceae bacterium]